MASKIQKSTVQKNKKTSRNSRRTEEQQQSESHLPTMRPFQALKPFSIVGIDEDSSIEQIAQVIPQCDEATKFSIYTEKDPFSGFVISISIEIIQSNENESVMIIMAPERLPRKYSHLYMIIRTMLRSIFCSNKKIMIWDYHTAEDLLQFFYHNYLGWSSLGSINYISVSSEFKKWFKTKFPSRINDLPPIIPHYNRAYCNCYRLSYTHKNHRWYLHAALRYVTGEYIVPNNGCHNLFYQRIQPAILSCMAITKLSLIFELN